MNPATPFRVTFNREFAEALDRLIHQAAQASLYSTFKKSLVEIENHLSTEPLTWGDPVRVLSGFRMTVYHRIHDQLSIVYAVNETDGLVWWTKLDPVLSHPCVKHRCLGGTDDGQPDRSRSQRQT